MLDYAAARYASLNQKNRLAWMMVKPQDVADQAKQAKEPRQVIPFPNPVKKAA